jgi:hypothetical protein
VEIVYGERWHTKQMAPIFPFSEDEARARHQVGELYTAAMGDLQAPVLVELHLIDGYVGVRWLHPLGKDQLAYRFRQHDERLFLTEVAFNTINEEGKVAVSESTLFKPDGTMQVSVFDNENRTVKESEAVTKDVSLLWEDVPEFGHYESISRRER